MGWIYNWRLDNRWFGYGWWFENGWFGNHRRFGWLRWVVFGRFMVRGWL